MAIPKDGRLQVPEYNPQEALQPGALPGSTYVKPAVRDVDNGFAALAQALGGFASFATSQARKGEAEDKDGKLKKWSAEFALLDPTEQKRRISAGEVPKDYRDVAGTISGMDSANKWNRSIPGMMEGYDPAVDGSKEDFILKKRQEGAAGLTPEELVGFEAGTRTEFAGAQDAARKEIDAEAALAKQNKFVGYLRINSDAGIKANKDANAIVKQIFIDADLDPQLTGLLPTQKNAVFFEMAQEYAAQGRPDLVKAMAAYDRPGVGTINDTIEWRDKFDALADTANKNYNDTKLLQDTPKIQGWLDKSGKGEFTLEDAHKGYAELPSRGQEFYVNLYSQSEEVKAKRSMINDLHAGNKSQREAISKTDLTSALGGTFDTDNPNRQVIVKNTRNADGTITSTDVEVSFEDRKADVIYNISRMSEGLREQGWSEEQIRAKEMTIFSQNNLVNKTWEAQMDTLAVSGSMSAATKGDTSDLQVTGELYRNLYDVNATLAKNHIGSNPANELWAETFRMAREGGQTPTDATILAAKAVENLNAGVKFKLATKEGASSAERGQTALKALVKNGDDTWFGAGDSVAVGIVAGHETAKRAEFYMGTGMAEDKALVKAAEWMKATHVVVGQSLVFAGYEGQPKNFKERVDGYLIDKFGEEDAGNYSLMEIDGGRTYAITDPNGMIVFDEKRDDKDSGPSKPSIFTVKELVAHGQAKADKVLFDQVAAANAATDAEVKAEDLKPVSMYENPAVKASPDDRDLLIRTVLGEALGEDAVGQAAVAHVIVNRSMDERWDETIGDVATSKNKDGYYQFSAWNTDGKEGNAAVMIDAKDPRYLAAAAVVDKVLSGETPDPTGGAVYYVAPNSLTKPPKWWEAARGERNGAVLTIGNHTFTGKRKDRKPKPGDESSIKSKSLVKFSRAPTASHPIDVASLKPEMKKGLNSLISFWNEDLVLNSASRDAKTNAKVGGAKGSQHKQGNAVDISVAGWSLEKRKKFIQTASANGFTGIGVYNNAIHLDMGQLRAWGPSYKIGSVPAWARGAIASHLYKQTASLN